jgi:hypothetical protein
MCARVPTPAPLPPLNMPCLDKQHATCNAHFFARGSFTSSCCLCACLHCLQSEALITSLAPIEISSHVPTARGRKEKGLSMGGIAGIMLTVLALVICGTALATFQLWRSAHRRRKRCGLVRRFCGSMLHRPCCRASNSNSACMAGTACSMRHDRGGSDLPSHEPIISLLVFFMVTL